MTNSPLLQHARIDPVAALLRACFLIFVTLLWIVFLTLAFRFRFLEGGTFGAQVPLAALLLTLWTLAFFCAQGERRRRGELSVSMLRRFCPAALVPTVATGFLLVPIFRGGAVFLLLMIALGFYGSIWLFPAVVKRFGRWRVNRPQSSDATQAADILADANDGELSVPTASSTSSASSEPTTESSVSPATFLFDAANTGDTADPHSSAAVGVLNGDSEENPPRTEFLPGLFAEPEAFDSETIKIPVGAFDASIPASLDDDFSDSDELEPESAELEPDASRLYFENRYRIDGGREQIEGWFRPHFEPRQEVCVVHLTFQPPFADPPQLELFQLFGGEVALNVGRIESFGARIEVKRRLSSGVMNDDVVADGFPDETVRIGFFATGAMTEPV